MQSRNPIQQRIHAEAVKRVAHQFLGMEHFSIWALVAAAAFFWGAGWLPDAFTNLLLPRGEKIAGLIQLAGSVSIFTIFGLILRHKMNEVQQVRVVHSVPAAARVLVLFLSTITAEQTAALERAVADGTFSPESLKKSSWEMPYLAILHHAQRLQNIFVITSAGERGTHLLLPLFTTVVGILFPKVTIEAVLEQGIDFEDVAAVHRAIDELYARLDETRIYGPQDIMVDITGGQKTNSIAAAMATLAEGRRFQYVSTRNTDNVLCYDMVVEKK